jgi:CubicO group peptidase (beta-lactamase class C family)
MSITIIIIGALYVSYVLFYPFSTKPKLEIDGLMPQEERLSHMDKWLRDLHKNGMFNGAVLVARNGSPLIMKLYGFTDHTAKKRLSSKSSFRLASLSKQFTAAGILILVEKGILRLDDLVRKHIENFPYVDVTIRHLLNHTSGLLDDYMSLAEEHRAGLGEFLSISDVLELIIKHPQKKNLEPSSEYCYNNTNYVLLAAIIEEKSKKTFEDFMKEELFDPLGMKNSRVWNLLSNKPFLNKADGFAQYKDVRQELKPTWIDGVAGDGAVFCSLEDLLIWDQFWYGNSLISNDLIRESYTKPILNDGSQSDYGFGWIIEKDKLWHNGALLGVKTHYIRFPENRGCLIIIENSANLDIDSTIEKFIKVSSPLFAE